uniref:Uncharacterized protein n=1 Tax=Anguilla anguilla TaxID=7936 RepID=A0A0E9U5S3_ANGAN
MAIEGIVDYFNLDYIYRGLCVELQNVQCNLIHFFNNVMNL